VTGLGIEEYLLTNPTGPDLVVTLLSYGAGGPGSVPAVGMWIYNLFPVTVANYKTQLA
jgi:hypothetical protein